MFQITANDSLPTHICCECFGHLSNFNKFRQDCRNSDAFLREQIVIESIKVEPVDEIGVKSERNVTDEFYEAEYIDEALDPESTVNFIDIANPFDSTKFICDYCGQQFDRKNQIGSHMVKHRNEMLDNGRPKQFPCTVVGCADVFENRKLFNNHQVEVHRTEAEARVNVPTVTEKKLKLCCQQCPKWFTIQHKLDAHIRRQHEGLKV